MPVTDDGPSAGEGVLAFGPFQLLPGRRVLLREGLPVKIRDHACDILRVLVEHAGDVVDKRELLLRVWPQADVEEALLRLYISVLRRTLEEGKDGARYIENVSGQGYRFVAPVTRMSVPRAPPEPLSAHGIPAPPPRMLGRDAVLARLLTRLPRRRFITIAGPGGVGKTTLAIAAVNSLAAAKGPGAEHFAAVGFIELGSIVHPAQVPAGMAAALGLADLSPDPVADIARHLGHRRMLLVLDSCEQVVHVIAPIVERLLALAPELHVLATSREPLRARTESVLRLSPLELPPSAARLTLAEALGFPAVNLFIRCATESDDSFELDAADIPTVVAICHQLDGLPLAIELAAARADVFGVRTLASSLRDLLKFLTRGRRTAVPRHRTLRATLEWSHETLSPVERVALRRLGIFNEPFDAEAARAVLADPDIDGAHVWEILMSLAAKSLLESQVTGARLRFSLLETSRAFALEKLGASGEGSLIERRYAQIQHERP